MNRSEVIRKIKSGTTMFEDLDIEGSFFDNELENIKFSRCFFDSDFSGAEINTTFESCNLKGCNFRYAFLKYTVFKDNLLDSTDFSFTNFKEAYFINNSYYSIVIDNNNYNLLKIDDRIGFNIHEVKIWMVWFVFI